MRVEDAGVEGASCERGILATFHSVAWMGKLRILMPPPGFQLDHLTVTTGVVGRTPTSRY